MIQAYEKLRTLLNSKRRITESLVFYLHYRITFLVLLFCCVLVSTQQFSSHKIQCQSKPSTGINVELLNSYCWAASTYSIRSTYLKEAGIGVPHPGVGSSENKAEYEYRNFYQYIHIILFIQAILFYIPHLIWKSVERNFTTSLTSAIEATRTDSSSPPTDKPIDTIAIYIEDRWGSHKLLVLKYIFCEFLSLLNVLVQSYFLDILFHGKFISLGLFVEAYYGSEILSDPIRLFPLVTICTFKRYGPTGSIDVINSLCVLPDNAVNAKIYLCLWFLFLVLAIFSVLSLLHLLSCVFSSVHRTLLPRLSLVFGGTVDSDCYTKVLRAGDFGDWFFLCAIKNVMDGVEFNSLLENLQSRLCSFETETKELKSV